MTKTERTIRGVIDRMRTYDDPNARQACSDLERLLPKRVRKAEPSRVAREKSRNFRAYRMAEIRAEMGARCAGKCELCGGQYEECHHVLSGPLRRVRESLDTCLGLCGVCHRALHRHDFDTMERAYNYCLESGMPDAAAALRRRIDKAMASRAQHPSGAKPLESAK